MSATYRKKLIEVSLPLVAINAASAKEKSIRHGHPSTLHLWWARRPLAACRAVLFASLVDDPDSDPMFAGNEELAASKRAELFNLIEELVLWENSNNPRVINKARAEIARSIASGKIADGVWKKETNVAPGATAYDIKHMLAKSESVNAFLAEHAPPVLDPFCGGGSIPLEAQRLGLRAYASDLNPVPVLINRALIEIPPKFAGRPPVNPSWQQKQRNEKAATVWNGAYGIADDVRYYGQWMRDQAEKRIGHLYPKVKITKKMAKDRPDLDEYVGEELTVMAWLWARTVASPSPVYQGVHVPLIRSYWLSKKPVKSVWITPVVDRKHQRYSFAVHMGKPSVDERKEIEAGTKLSRGCKFRCLLSDSPIPEEHIKNEGKAGRLGSTLLAIVAEGTRGRVYLPAESLPPIEVERPGDLRGLDAPLANDPRNLWCLGYGLDTFDKLFTNRQLVTLGTFSELVTLAREQVLSDARHTDLPGDERSLTSGGMGATAYADAIAVYLAFSINKCATRNCTQTTWYTARDSTMAGFSRQAIVMTWDYAEVNPLLESTGSLAATAAWVSECLEFAVPLDAVPGRVEQRDAADHAMPQNVAISCDPPYYDNIGYADLSDFFYVLLRSSLAPYDPSLFATLVTPKARELIATPYRHNGSGEAARQFFEEGLGRSFALMRTAQAKEWPLTIFYAFKQSESDDDDDAVANGNAVVASTGWETMLEAVSSAGFSVQGTWPMRTEQPHGLRVIDANSLASSIVLVCRPRSQDAALASRKEFINALRRELPSALRDLQAGNIAPVDLAQAAIGPGMAVFTRYSKVMETDGSPMTVRTSLGLINQALDEVLAEQEGEFDADTRWALAWFQEYGMKEGPFGTAETLSKAKNTAVNGLVDAGVVEAKKGKVRLVGRDELPDGWNPTTDTRLTTWEVTQYLIRALEQAGESAAATLVRQLGGTGELARDLAYRLYAICERKKWAQEATSYNGLVIAWPELTKLARSIQSAPTQRQLELE